MRFQRICVWVGFAALGLAAAGCGGGYGDDAATADAPPMEYTVRGEIVALPAADAEVPQVRIRHEAIPDFVGYDGAASGMAAMTMPFVADEALSFEGVNVGDKIEFDFDVVWDRTHSLIVHEIRVLPSETELTLAP